MDLLAFLYSFIISLGGSQFVVNETVELSPTLLQVDVETMGLRENKRYILLLENGKAIQQVRVPLTAEECKSPH